MPRFPGCPQHDVEAMAIDRVDRTVVTADSHGPTKARDGVDARSLDRLVCALAGHDWMPNGTWPLRVGHRWLGDSPDWQRCFRCGRWELLP
jgi:hypothetical protein